jgi:hypothetical protein
MRDGINAFIETNFFKIRYIFEDDSHNADEPDDPLPLPDVSFERTHPGNLCDLDVIYQYEESNPSAEKSRRTGGATGVDWDLY